MTTTRKPNRTPAQVLADLEAQAARIRRKQARVKDETIGDLERLAAELRAWAKLIADSGDLVVAAEHLEVEIDHREQQALAQES